MNDLRDELSKILGALNRGEVLEHLILVGSWVLVIYEEYFKDSNYSPTIRTTDIDFLVPNKNPKINDKKDISSLLDSLGFSEVFSSDGWVTYHKPELHVEFLFPRIGPRSDSVVSIPMLGINARPIRHLQFLVKNTISVEFQGLDVTVPHPAAYALQKLIICGGRKNFEKAQKDLEQAETVLTALTQRSDVELLRSLFSGLTHKQKKAVLDSVKKRVVLEDVFKNSILTDG